MKMKRNGRYQAEFTLPGYITQIVDIVAKNKAEGVVAVLGNVIVGGVVGVVVDGVTGSGLTLVPDPVNVKLEPENKVATETAK
jgi:hypothetical protein